MGRGAQTQSAVGGVGARWGMSTFEVEDDGEFRNPLGVEVRTTDVETTGSQPRTPDRSEDQSAPRSPVDGRYRRTFRLSVATTDPLLQAYFPNGVPRQFPENRGASSRVAATSYEEINELIAKNFTIPGPGIYIMCYQKDSAGNSDLMDPYAQGDDAKLALFRAVPAAGMVRIAAKRAAVGGSANGEGGVDSQGQNLSVLMKVAQAAYSVSSVVDNAVATGGKLVIDAASYGGEHNPQKRRKGLYRIKCAGRGQREPMQRFMCHPLSPMKVLWDIIQGFIVLYLFVFLPVQIAFAHAHKLELTTTKRRTVVLDERFEKFFGSEVQSNALEAPSFDNVIDWLILVDFVVQFRTAYYLEHNDASTEIVASQRQILLFRVFGRAHNYLPSVSFLVSLITTMPLDQWLIPYYGAHGAYYFRAVKCLRVEQLKHTMPFFEAFIERWTIVIPALKPMASLLAAVILAVALCHIMSCMLYLSGHPMWEEPIWSETIEYDEDGTAVNSTLTMDGYVCDETDSCGWVVAVSWPENTTQWERYMTAYYYSFTIMSTVGFGDLHAKNPMERFVTTWIMLVGVAMYAVLLGAITSLIQANNLGHATFEEQMAQMATYLRSRGVHHELRLRIREYFDFAYPQRVLFDETTVLGMLPVKLRADVKLDMYSDAVDAIPFLPMGQADSTGTSSSVNLEVIRLVIAGILKPVTFMDREVLVHEGQRGHEMFIIIHGTVEVTVDGREDVLMLLGVCDCFGELSCLEPDRMWGHTVVSSGFTSVAKIERVELDW